MWIRFLLDEGESVDCFLFYFYFLFPKDRSFGHKRLRFYFPSQDSSSELAAKLRYLYTTSTSNTGFDTFATNATRWLIKSAICFQYWILQYQHWKNLWMLLVRVKLSSLRHSPDNRARRCQSQTIRYLSLLGCQAAMRKWFLIKTWRRGPWASLNHLF